MYVALACIYEKSVSTIKECISLLSGAVLAGFGRSQEEELRVLSSEALAIQGLALDRGGERL